jgi:hypothetical protein
MRMATATILTAVSMMTVAHPAMSEAPSDAGQHHGPPPPEAISACNSSTSGAQCSFSADGVRLTGTCWAPEGKPLACKPGSSTPINAPPAGK